MIWLNEATAEASSLGLGRFNFVTVQRSDTASQPALTEFMELSRKGDTLYCFTLHFSGLPIAITFIFYTRVCVCVCV